MGGGVADCRDARRASDPSSVDLAAVAPCLAPAIGQLDVVSPPRRPTAPGPRGHLAAARHPAAAITAGDHHGPLAHRPSDPRPRAGLRCAGLRLARLGSARLGSARLGSARLGLAWLGLAWPGLAWLDVT